MALRDPVGEARQLEEWARRLAVDHRVTESFAIHADNNLVRGKVEIVMTVAHVLTDARQPDYDRAVERIMQVLGIRKADPVALRVARRHLHRRGERAQRQKARRL